MIPGRRRTLSASERLSAFSRTLSELGALVDAAEDDPLVVADVAIALLGHANRQAVDEFCTKDEWVGRLLMIGALTVDHVAAWNEISWPEALRLLADRLEAEQFEREVTDDIWRLPG